MFGLFSQNFNKLSDENLKAIAQGKMLLNGKVVSKRDKLKCLSILDKRLEELFDKLESV